jgi:hypothetical protein
LSIVFDPIKMLKKIAPESKIKRLVSGKLGLRRTALSFVDAAADSSVGVLDKKAVADVALKTIRGYQEREAKAIAENNFERSAGTEFAREVVDDPRQLIQRVQNELIFQVHEKIKEKYGGQKARWLPSDSEEPRPEHQANYGETYIIGEGINGVEPGDEPGCKCGVEILVNETQLELE